MSRQPLFLTLILFLSALSSVHAQDLTVNAGNDSILCLSNNESDTFELGGASMVNGGVPPYVFEWTNNIDTVLTSITYWISNISEANPSIKYVYPTNGPKQWFLKVTDSLGNVAMDTVSITACGELPIPLGCPGISPTVGDTITMTLMSGYTCIDSITWSHPEKIVEDNGGAIRVLIDDVAFDYNSIAATIHTPCGVKQGFNCPVIAEVYPLGQEELDREVVSISPNPSNGNFQIQSTEQAISIQVFDMNGRRVEAEFVGNTLRIETAGTFIAKVHTATGVFRQRLVVIE